MAVSSTAAPSAGSSEPADTPAPWAPPWARGAADTAARLQDALNTRGAAAVLQELFSLPDSKEGTRSRSHEQIAASHWLQKLGGLEHLSCGFLQQAPKNRTLRSASAGAQEDLEIFIDDESPIDQSSDRQSLGRKVCQGNAASPVLQRPASVSDECSSRQTLDGMATSPRVAKPVPALNLSEVVANQNTLSFGLAIGGDSEPLAADTVMSPGTDETGENTELDGSLWMSPVAADEQAMIQAAMSFAIEGYGVDSGNEEQMRTDEDTHASVSVAQIAAPTETADYKGDSEVAALTADSLAFAHHNKELAGSAKVEAETGLFGRWKPTLESDWSPPSSAQALLDPALSCLYSELRPESLSLQIVGCMEGTAGTERSIWLREAESDSPSLVHGGAQMWIQEFCTENLLVAVCCRTGDGIGGINQDDYSITRLADGTTIYIVCDGHGCFGHLASFRVVQSLPKFIQQGLAREKMQPTENIIARAFMSSNVDLFKFAAEHCLDFNTSGTTCSVVLRQGDGVHVAWLGETRALIASVADGESSVDLMSSVHAASLETEKQRLLAKGAEIRNSRCQSARIYAPVMAPASPPAGLTVSRTLGDYALSPYGIIGHPDLTKTSFASVPGLVLMASGGLCEHLNDDDDCLQDTGDVLLDLMLGGGKLSEEGPQHALAYLCDVAQEVWRQQNMQSGICEDVTGLLLQWIDKPTQNCAVGLPVISGPVANCAVQEMLATPGAPSSPISEHAAVANSDDLHAMSQPLPDPVFQRIQVEETLSAEAAQPAQDSITEAISSVAADDQRSQEIEAEKQSCCRKSMETQDAVAERCGEHAAMLDKLAPTFAADDEAIRALEVLRLKLAGANLPAEKSDVESEKRPTVQIEHLQETCMAAPRPLLEPAESDKSRYISTGSTYSSSETWPAPSTHLTQDAPMLSSVPNSEHLTAATHTHSSPEKLFGMSEPELLSSAPTAQQTPISAAIAACETVLSSYAVPERSPLMAVSASADSVAPRAIESAMMQSGALLNQPRASTAQQALVEGPRLPEGPRVTRPAAQDQ